MTKRLLETRPEKSFNRRILFSTTWWIVFLKTLFIKHYFANHSILFLAHLYVTRSTPISNT